MPTPITNKAEMYRRLNAGLLGHTLPAAENRTDATKLLSRFKGGRFAIRLKTAGGLTKFNLTAAEAYQQIYVNNVGTWNLSPMLDDRKRIIYGHLWDCPGGWNLHYSDDPKPCSLKQYQDGCVQKTRVGLSARLFLKVIMDQAGWDTLERLVEDYPDHAIEFTVMSSSLDAFGPTNTVFWEVRTLLGGYEDGSAWVRK